VAAPSSVLQQFPLCPIESNGNENFKVIQNPGFLSDHPQNWNTGSLCHARHTLKIAERFVHNFLSYLANRQTNKQTKSGKNITSLAEVIKWSEPPVRSLNSVRATQLKWTAENCTEIFKFSSFLSLCTRFYTPCTVFTIFFYSTLLMLAKPHETRLRPPIGLFSI